VELFIAVNPIYAVIIHLDSRKYHKGRTNKFQSKTNDFYKGIFGGTIYGNDLFLPILLPDI